VLTVLSAVFLPPTGYRHWGYELSIHARTTESILISDGTASYVDNGNSYGLLLLQDWLV
jgi:hypothetical protein